MFSRQTRASNTPTNLGLCCQIPPLAPGIGETGWCFGRVRYVLLPSRTWSPRRSHPYVRMYEPCAVARCRRLTAAVSSYHGRDFMLTPSATATLLPSRRAHVVRVRVPPLSLDLLILRCVGCRSWSCLLVPVFSVRTPICSPRR